VISSTEGEFREGVAAAGCGNQRRLIAGYFRAHTTSRLTVASDAWKKRQVQAKDVAAGQLLESSCNAAVSRLRAINRWLIGLKCELGSFGESNRWLVGPPKDH
jgi:hypothetical protein